MVLFHEGFARCKKCDHPYFKKDEYFLIKNDVYDEAGLVEEYNHNVIYTCKRCNTVFAKIEKEE